MKRPSRPPQKAPPNLFGLVASKREDPPGPLVPFVEVEKKPRPPRKPRKAMNARNDERMDERNAVKFGPCSNMARLLPCIRCNRPPPGDPAHVESRASGGDDFANVVPLCRMCHSYQEHIGWADFQRKTGLDPVAIAKEVAEKVANHVCVEWVDPPDKPKRGKRDTCLICGEKVR